MAAPPVSLPISIPEEAVIANALEPVRQDMEQEPPDELLGGQGHRFTLTAVAIVFPLEADLTVFDIEQAVVGDRDAVGISADVVEHLLGSGERALWHRRPIRALSSGAR